MNLQQTPEKNRGCLFTAMIIVVTVIITVAVTFWVLTRYIFPQQFEPVELSQSEKQALDRKLHVFRGWGTRSESSTNSSDSTQSPAPALESEAYSEENADRSIRLNQRELNAMLAQNTDLAQRLAIDLSDNLASGKLLIPLDPDFPLMGGKTIKISAGLELSYFNERPIVILKGVSIMGVPIPNAWLGGLKNVDLVQEFGNQSGFWKAFSDGVDNIHVEDGQLVIKLKE